MNATCETLVKFSRPLLNSLHALFQSKTACEVMFVFKKTSRVLIPIENITNCHCKNFTLSLTIIDHFQCIKIQLGSEA